MKNRRKMGATVAVVAGIATSMFVVNHKRQQQEAPPVVSAAPAPPASMTAATSKVVDANPQAAISALMALPELKAQAEKIEKQSNGELHGAIIAGDGPLRTIDGKVYYPYSFVENGPERVRRWQGFYVTSDGSSIVADDDATGGTMSLADWRARLSRQGGK